MSACAAGGAHYVVGAHYAVNCGRRRRGPQQQQQQETRVSRGDQRHKNIRDRIVKGAIQKTTLRISYGGTLVVTVVRITVFVFVFVCVFVIVIVILLASC